MRVLVLTGLIVGAFATPAAAISDYGDAPDGASAYGGVTGHFPSRKASNGARHARIGRLQLGRGESSESDSRQVDVDALDDGFSADLASCKTGFVEFVVNAAGLPAAMRTAGHTAYLNAWFDWNRNGRWSGGGRCGGKAAPEWAVKNVAIRLGSFATKPIQVIRVEVFGGPKTKDVWQRATLTLDQRVRLSGGRGRFRVGETEDYGPRQLTRVSSRAGRGRVVEPIPDDKPAAMCRARMPGKAFAPPGMPAFIEHGDFEALRVTVLRGRGDVTVKLRKPKVFGSRPKGIKTTLLPVGSRRWSVGRDVIVASTVEDTRGNPFQLVVVPVDITGTRVGTLHTDCVVIVAHEVTPAGANTFQPGPGTTIDTTVGPPTITGGGQSGGGSTTDGSGPVTG